MTVKPQSDRVTLVTGASRGIGRAVALAIAQAGGHVVALARTQGALEELDDDIRAVGGTATLVPGDVTDAAALERLAGALNERFGRLDGLVAAAGILGFLSPVPHLETKTWDDVLAVNLTANFHLIRLLDPLLRASKAGRAVFFTSGVVPRPRAFWGAYAASKGGLEMLVKCYAHEVENTNLRVALLDPGATATKMRAKAMPGEDPATLPQPEDVAPVVLKLLDPGSKVHGDVVSARDLMRE